MIARRRYIALCGAAVAAPFLLRGARAQTYPTRFVRLIVPFPPGGAVDAAAVGGDRRIDQRLSKRLQLRKGAFLVAAHQSAIASNIRRQHGRQSSFHAFAGQTLPSDGKLSHSIKA